MFYFVVICSGYKLNFATLRHGGTGPGLFLLGAFPTFRSHDIRHGCLYVESSEGGRERRIEAIRYRRRLKIFENFLLKMRYNNLKKLALNFQVAIHFHPGDLQVKTFAISFSALTVFNFYC